MKNMDDVLAQLVPERKLPQEKLSALHLAVMSEIRANPVDFISLRELDKRRKQGLILIISAVLMLLSFSVLVWWSSSTIFGLWSQIMLTAVHIWTQSIFGQYIGVFLQKFSMILSLKSGIVTLGATYAWQLTGIGVIAVLVLAELRDKLTLDSYKH